ncbi:9435_t:CDS:2, partial [Racocetra fulgida]
VSVDNVYVNYFYAVFGSIAESELFTAEAKEPNFPIAILQLITKENTDPSEDESKIPSEIRNAIKECIIDILVSVPTNIQLQLSEAVTLIAESDFPANWQNLIQLINYTIYSSDIDEELFEYDPIEFIRRDIEGSAASDFVRSMMTHFMKDITRIIGTYINQFLKNVEELSDNIDLQQYNEDPNNWKDKDAAIYLLTSIATPGTATKYGLTVVNDLVNVVEWFTENILPDLQTPVDSGQPVLKVDAIKYLYTFRNQAEFILIGIFYLGNIPALVRFLHAYLYRDSLAIIANKQLEPILGIFQKLIASKANDKYAPTEIENYDAEEELLNFDFEEDRQFQTTFAKLTTANKPRIDPTASIPEPKSSIS